MIIEIDPKVDIVFKKIFGSPKHSNLTLSFVNAILTAAGLPIAKKLTIQNPFRLAEFFMEKDIELDILYEDTTGKQIQLEMQMVVHKGLTQRMLHNWSQLYFQQIKKGDTYTEHKEVVSIWILNDVLCTDKNWLHVFRAQCPMTGYRLHDDFCIITVELPYWLALIEREKTIIFDSKDKWLFFLTKSEGEDSEELLSKLSEPEYAEAIQIMAEFTRAEKMRHYYQMRANYQHIVASYKETGYDEGLSQGQARGLELGKAEGIEVGKAEGKIEGKIEGIAEGEVKGRLETLRETAKILKEKGASTDLIIAVSGFSIEEVLAL